MNDVSVKKVAGRGRRDPARTSHQRRRAAARVVRALGVVDVQGGSDELVVRTPEGGGLEAMAERCLALSVLARVASGGGRLKVEVGKALDEVQGAGQRAAEAALTISADLADVFLEEGGNVIVADFARLVAGPIEVHLTGRAAEALREVLAAARVRPA